MQAIYTRLDRCLAVAVASRMQSFPIVKLQPRIDIVLRLIDALIDLFAERHLIELLQNRAVETYASRQA